MKYQDLALVCMGGAAYTRLKPAIQLFVGEDSRNDDTPEEDRWVSARERVAGRQEQHRRRKSNQFVSRVCKYFLLPVYLPMTRLISPLGAYQPGLGTLIS